MRRQAIQILESLLPTMTSLDVNILQMERVPVHLPNHFCGPFMPMVSWNSSVRLLPRVLYGFVGSRSKPDSTVASPAVTFPGLVISLGT